MEISRPKGLTFKALDLIVITHAHSDHAGSAGKLQKILCGTGRSPQWRFGLILTGKPMTYCPTGWFGWLFF
ncbi:MBL fold metallo-hydrolase [Microbulbifer echini]|uniref:MBL fold metallo-hydrolase n=1 Tax=Microbulbifer echini TaxID=1529067 RepID=A0ABV4NLI5_9GAMM